MKERRKSRRCRIPINIEVIRSKKKTENILGELKDFSSDGFSFTSKDLDCGLNEIIKMRFKLLPEAKYVNILGTVIWKIQLGHDSHVGIEINEIRSAISIKDLCYPLILWKNKITKK